MKGKDMQKREVAYRNGRKQEEYVGEAMENLVPDIV
jgi:hypothetical protein